MSCFQIKSKKYNLENTSHTKMCVSRIFYEKNQINEEDQTKIPLTFTAEEANTTLKIQQNGSAPTLNLEYNLNDSGWTTYTRGNTITLANVGDKVQMRATEAGNATFSSSGNEYNQFVMTGRIGATGNIQSLLDQTMSKTNVANFCYCYLFSGCTALTQAPALPAAELAELCYGNMFNGCTSLTTAPALPSTTLALYCYAYMFNGCTSLTEAPELPATTVINNGISAICCYQNMFCGCTSLTVAPKLPSTTVCTGCYSEMFKNATKIKDIYAPNINWSDLRLRVSAIGNQICLHQVTIHCKDQDITLVPSCFLKGTQITLANGNKKAIEEITYDDVLKVWNFDEGREDSAAICWLTRPGLANDHYYKLTFSNGTVLKTTGQNSNHKVYNVDERFFKGVDKTKIGDRIWSENGIVVVTDKQYIEEEVEYYNIITTNHINCYAEGILTSDRYGNRYPVDESMKFIKTDNEIRPYSEYEAAGISKYWYDTLRLGEVPETVEKTKDYIIKLETQMRDLERTQV